MDRGAIPRRSTMSRFSDEERSLQNRARGFDSFSVLRDASVAQWKGRRLLIGFMQVRVLPGVLTEA